MSTGTKWLCVAVTVPILVVLAAIYGAYWYGASALPANMEPDAREYPIELRQLYWKSMGGAGDIAIRKLDPLKFSWMMAGVFRSANDGHVEPRPPDMQVLTSVARIRVSGLGSRLPTIRRMFAEIASMIRISREWSASRVIDTALAELWFGRGARGFDEAARTYFDAGVDELSPEESLGLVALIRGPSYYDPTCRRERFVERYRFLANRVGMPADEAAIARSTSRLRPIDCPR